MIVFDPLWDTMKGKKISQYALTRDYGVSTGTLDALRRKTAVSPSIPSTSCAAFCNVMCPM